MENQKEEKLDGDSINKVDGDSINKMDGDSFSSGGSSSSDEESPPPCLLDVEGGVTETPSRRPHPTFPFIEHSNPHEAPTGGIRRQIGDLTSNGDELLTKVPTSPGEMSIRREEPSDDQSSRQPRSASTISLTPSLRAAAPLPGLRSSRRLSLPGAFRMGRRGATSPSEENSAEEEQSTSRASSQSANFYTHNAHEVLIEATLVCDRSLATNDNDPVQQQPRESYTSATTATFHHQSASSSELVVEAKPVRGFCLCDVMGNWKAICFVVLLIVAIAGVAAVIERHRPLEEDTGVRDAEMRSATAAPSPIALPLESVQEWSTSTTMQLLPSNSPSQSAPPSSSPSLFPTGAPTSFIQSLPISTQEAFINDPQSPQALAMDWIYQDPRFNEYDAWQLTQRFALVAFYYALDGPNWARQDSWLEYDVNECEWYSDLPLERVCSQDGHYTELMIQSNLLMGTLPQELWLLGTLRNLTMYMQPVHGDLPTDFADANELEELTLKNLVLKGSLPSSLGKLKKLSKLQLSKNALRQHIPSELGKLSILESLHLDENLLQGGIPSELGQMTSLKFLYLDENTLTSSLPSHLGALTAKDVFFNNNELIGPLPMEFFTNALSSSLVNLELQANALSGGIQSEIGLLGNAQGIDLAFNLLTGTLPSELGTLGNITTLLLESNHIEGTIPSQLGLLTKLSALMLHDNALTGPVPKELCELKQRQPTFELSVDCDRVRCQCNCNCELSSSILSSGSVGLAKQANGKH